MSGHTPGPWHVGDGSAESNFEGDNCVIALRAGRTTTLVQVNPWFGDESKANAHLIANAPYLLETLKRAHACATLQPDGTCEGCFVSEVIARAEGR